MGERLDQQGAGVKGIQRLMNTTTYSSQDRLSNWCLSNRLPARRSGRPCRSHAIRASSRTAFGGLEHDQEGIEGHLFLLSAQPGFKFPGRSAEITLCSLSPTPRAKSKARCKSRDPAHAGFRGRRGEIAESVEQLVMSGILFMRFSGVEELRSHARSPFLKSRRPATDAHLRLDRGLIDQHDGDIVLHRVDPVALRTSQAFRVLAVLERLLAGWTNQRFQEVFGNHDSGIVRQGWAGRVMRLTTTGGGNHLEQGPGTRDRALRFSALT